MSRSTSLKGNPTRLSFVGNDDGTWRILESISDTSRSDWNMLSGMYALDDRQSFAVEGATEYHPGFIRALREIVQAYSSLAAVHLKTDGPWIVIGDLVTNPPSTNWGDILFLHGTSAEAWKKIQTQGLSPRTMTQASAAYGVHSSAAEGDPSLVYLTTQTNMAHFAARDAAKMTGSTPVVIAVRGVDPRFVRPDADSRRSTAAESLASLGSIGYAGKISPDRLSLVERCCNEQGKWVTEPVKVKENPAKGRDWAKRVYEEKLQTGSFANIGKQFPDDVKAARSVQSIALKKLYVKDARSSRRVEAPLPRWDRVFWADVLAWANEQEALLNYPEEWQKAQAHIERFLKAGELDSIDLEFLQTKYHVVQSVLDRMHGEGLVKKVNGVYYPVKDNPTLSHRDKKVIDAFVARKKASSPTLDSDGRRLHRSVGNEDVARWMGDRIVETSTESTRHDQTILRYLRKKAKTVSGYGQPTYAKGLRFFEGGDAIYQGQWDGYIVAYVPQREAPVGRLDYSEYGGRYSIKMVEVDPAYRRYGVSTVLFEHLLREHKITQADIDRGMQTEDGHQFRKAVDSYLPNPITRKLKPSKQDVPAPLKAAANGLLRWRGVEALGGKDVLAWVQKDGTSAFAFQGPALLIETRALNEEHYPINNRGSQADLSLQRSVGLDAKLERGSGWTGVQGGVGQTMSEGEVSLDEVADAIPSILEAAIGSRPHFTMMPLEGEPYEGKPTPYYSAKKQKVFEGQAPGNIIKVEVFEDGKDVQKVGVDFCTVADRISETEGGVVGTLSGEDRFFLSHAFSVEGEQVDAKASAKLIKECGGLLYPSLALSDVPANNFGLCTLFFHMGLMVKHIKPYKKPSRGAWQVITYDTDAWTERTRNFAGNASAELYAQLTGQWEPRTYGHMMVLGPEAVEGTAGMGHDVKQVKTVTNLRSALKLKRARWKRGMTEEQIEQASDLTSHRYPYLEVKINGILDLGSVPLATCPCFQKKAAVAFLKAIGFRGELIVVKVPEDIKRKLTTYVGGKAEAKATWDYAWLVRDAVIAWQEKRDTKVKKWNEMWLEHVTDGGELSRPKL